MNPRRIWKRYIDDTFVIQHQLHKRVLDISVHLVTLVSVEYPTFLCDVPILEDHQEVLDYTVSFEIDLDLHLSTNIIEAFAQFLDVWYNHVDVLVVGVVVVGGMVVMVWGLVDTVSGVDVGLESVKDPNGILALM